MQDPDAAYLGIDMGTGGARAFVVTGAGTVLARGDAPLSCPGPSGTTHEQDPEAWWSAVCAACRQAMSGLDARQRACLRAAAVDATSGTVAFLDAAGIPLRPAMLYSDPRGGAEAEELNQLSGDHTARHGYRFGSSFALSKILHVQRSEPALFRRCARIAHQSDYLLARLTNRWDVSDYSNALKTGYDLFEERWPAWLDAFPDILGRLPEVLAPGTLAGTVTRAAAEATGLPEGLAVATGASDGVAACLASGVRYPGDSNTTVGTTLVFKTVSAKPCTHPDGTVYSHKLPGGLWLPGAASNTGAVWTRAWFPDTDPAGVTRDAAHLLPTETLAYPLTGRGERFPFRRDTAEGFIVPETDDIALRFAACMQGTAFIERLALDTLDGVTGASGGAVFSTGGASANDLWMQCRADATGRRIHRPACPDSALGAAVLAAAACTSQAPLELAADMVRIERTFEPDPTRRSQYDALYQRFLEKLGL